MCYAILEIEVYLSSFNAWQLYQFEFFLLCYVHNIIIVFTNILFCFSHINIFKQCCCVVSILYGGTKVKPRISITKIRENLLNKHMFLILFYIKHLNNLQRKIRLA